MKKAIAQINVQLYDQEIGGVYKAGDVLEGEKAELALKRYPFHFTLVNPEKKGGQ